MCLALIFLQANISQSKQKKIGFRYFLFTILFLLTYLQCVACDITRLFTSTSAIFNDQNFPDDQNSPASFFHPQFNKFTYNVALPPEFRSAYYIFFSLCFLSQYTNCFSIKQSRYIFIINTNKINFQVMVLQLSYSEDYYDNLPILQQF